MPPLPPLGDPAATPGPAHARPRGCRSRARGPGLGPGCRSVLALVPSPSTARGPGLTPSARSSEYQPSTARGPGRASVAALSSTATGGADCGVGAAGAAGEAVLWSHSTAEAAGPAVPDRGAARLVQRAQPWPAKPRPAARLARCLTGPVLACALADACGSPARTRRASASNSVSQQQGQPATGSATRCVRVACAWASASHREGGASADACVRRLGRRTGARSRWWWTPGRRPSSATTSSRDRHAPPPHHAAPPPHHAAPPPCCPPCGARRVAAPLARACSAGCPP